MKSFFALGCLCLSVFAGVVRADVIDDHAALENVMDEALLDLYGERWDASAGAQVTEALSAFGNGLTSPEAKLLWNAELPGGLEKEPEAARNLGELEGRLEHVAALEMVHRQEAGDIEGAREWRSVIQLPKYASSVEGAMALQALGGESQHRLEVSRLLAREYVQWQITRAREKTDALGRLVADGRATSVLVQGRASEIESLSRIPSALLTLALPSTSPAVPAHTAFDAVLTSASGGSAANLAPAISAWRVELESGYPNLLSADDVARRERIVLKLLHVIPTEYNSGVRNGEITIPLEYREAKTFTIQAEQVINELMPVWRTSKTKALEEHGPALLKNLDALEDLINRRKSQAEIETVVKGIMNSLESDFGLSLKRAGTAADVVAETVLEIRSLLGQSLAAAKEGQWRKAEQFRADAYVNFDLELESRAVPRDPNLAIAAEKTFLDGESGAPGIKAALDARLSGDQLTAAYQRAFDSLDQTAALLRVGLSPAAAMANAVVIILREGLEAVVILAALLAGLRGPENAPIRKQIGVGSWLAIAASVLLFVLSRYLLSGLSRYGETLEAVISIIAVAVLLIVTNWVFHKYYWSGWNAKLRQLSKAALTKQGTAYERYALVGVGFATIFREGFETTLFMQSLILEAGMGAVLKGIAIGALAITVLGFAVFMVGAKLPYRKMLIYTGGLVVLVLFTFLGSTARLFQTVGWLTVHPIPGFRLPNWTGTWLGLYPTWEGMIAPFLAFAYVGIAWLWVKFSSKRSQAALKAAGVRPVTT